MRITSLFRNSFFFRIASTDGRTQSMLKSQLTVILYPVYMGCGKVLGAIIFPLFVVLNKGGWINRYCLKIEMFRLGFWSTCSH